MSRLTCAVDIKWSRYHSTQARPAKQNAVESKLKSCAECLLISPMDLTRASHPPAAFKHLILISVDKVQFGNCRLFAADLFNTTLVLRKRHFTYRLISVHETLLRVASARCEAVNSARPAEGPPTASEATAEGPRAPARNTRTTPAITHGWVVLTETERFATRFTRHSAIICICTPAKILTTSSTITEWAYDILFE